ncbi:MAG: sugar transferase [Bacteroidales bacterium]|nr:sugar transferase [Bacteroidales bacterium]
MLKRLFDLLLSLAALVVLWPLMLLAAIVIKVNMPGPVLFKQTRIGRYARPFVIYKFRTMRINNSKVSVTLSTDSRITPFGNFLRKTKIDELPQLFNILKGEMSIVGPRPDVPGYYDTLKGEDQLIWQLRPGLTGLDSMCYPNEQAILDREADPERYYDEVLWPDKVRLNRWYAENRSFWMDVRIVLNTASLLLMGKQVVKVGGLKRLERGGNLSERSDLSDLSDGAT